MRVSRVCISLSLTLLRQLLSFCCCLVPQGIPPQIKWLKLGEHAKILGVPLWTHDQEEEWWEEKYLQIKTKMANWHSLTGLSIHGRVMLANAMIYSYLDTGCSPAAPLTTFYKVSKRMSTIYYGRKITNSTFKRLAPPLKIDPILSTQQYTTSANGSKHMAWSRAAGLGKPC
jgi:hypothetical protein